MIVALRILAGIGRYRMCLLQAVRKAKFHCTNAWMRVRWTESLRLALFSVTTPAWMHHRCRPTAACAPIVTRPSGSRSSHLH